jgi:DNA-binding response OmpR family regulator
MRNQQHHTSKVLLADNDHQYCETIAGGLIHRGWNVITVRDGMEALDLLSAERFAGALLDVNIPCMDGIEVIRRLRARGNMTPIVAVTASIRGAEALEAGAQSYVIKPVSVEQLSRVIDQHFYGPTLAT